ncbi:MAG: fluoride efflux transporter CrcB [Planctomycetaceae bacterium]|nr:fluoride efflux transporter CrcB [Planctomycetaceae bacterium]
MLDWFIAFCVHPVTLLAVGGGTGANARYWFGRFVARLQGEVEFPWATFLINVSGSIILGFVAASFMRHPDPTQRNWYLLLGAGFCGGFTTFSTFSYETYRLMEDGRLGLAAVYSLGSVVAGLLGVWAALKLSGTPAGG